MNATEVIIILSAVIAAGNIAFGDRLEGQGCALPSADKAGEVAATIILSAQRNPRISYQTQSSAAARVITERALARILFEGSKAEGTSLKPQARRVKNVVVAQQIAALRNGRQNSCGSREQSGGRYFFERLEHPTNKMNWKKS